MCNLKWRDPVVEGECVLRFRGAWRQRLRCFSVGVLYMVMCVSVVEFSLLFLTIQTQHRVCIDCATWMIYYSSTDRPTYKNSMLFIEKDHTGTAGDFRFVHIYFISLLLWHRYTRTEVTAHTGEWHTYSQAAWCTSPCRYTRAGTEIPVSFTATIEASGKPFFPWFWVTKNVFCFVLWVGCPKLISSKNVLF